MAKTTAPALSFDASGAIAKTIVYAKTRGVRYARRYTVPANPKTTGQVLTRDIFRAGSTRWLQGPTLMRAPWERFAIGQASPARTSYMGKQISLTRGDADMANYIGSPGAKGGLAPASLVLTTVAAGGIEGVVVAPATPTGWTLQAAVMTVLKNQAPETVVGDVIQAVEDVSSPYSCDIVGLDTVLYWAQAWLRWEKADLTIAYGASLSQSITVT